MRAPPGHTRYSWFLVKKAGGRVPDNHTPFSWGAEAREDEVIDSFLVHMCVTTGAVDYSAGDGPAAFRDRSPRALCDHPAAGLSLLRLRAPTAEPSSLWQVCLHGIRGGCARFSLRSLSTSRFLRETDDGIVQPCADSGGAVGGWEAPVQAVVGPSRGLPCKVRSASTGRYLTLMQERSGASAGRHGVSLARTTSDRRLKASDVSLLATPPAIDALLAFDGRRRRHDSVNPASIVDELLLVNLEEKRAERESNDPRFAQYLERLRSDAAAEVSLGREGREEQGEGEEEDLGVAMARFALNVGASMDDPHVVDADDLGAIPGGGREVYDEGEARAKVVIVVRHGLSCANMQRDAFGGDCDVSYTDASLSPMGRL